VPEKPSTAAAAEDLHSQEVDNGDGMTGQELTTTVLIMVLKAYQSCLSEAMSDSRIDVVGLMPQVRVCVACSHAWPPPADVV